MKRLLKILIPLPVRVKIKWARAAWMDMVSGPLPPRVPLRRQTFIGGGDFAAVGDDFLNQLKACGLKPNMKILDAGCGQGRMARPLVNYLTGGGAYDGFDIVRSGIDWCRGQYKDVPNFTFQHANVKNERYNKDGNVAAKDYVFPYPDESFDFVFLTSVFTHMFKEDIENYLSEIYRVLKPSGRSLITWFIMRDGGGETDLDFAHTYDEVTWTTLKSNPEAALAFDREFVLRLYESCGFKMPNIHEGQWATIGGPSYQDTVTADKPCAPSL